ncbi:TPA: bifunctional phosphoribosylaminoimidazolecarboxamide formyltransferase/IMP cyclohydrolase PurH [candidate division WOR-3 bacterium]|jgi:phosphoribosylaminoimidazolecarboxamide formyltransferase/IMP cyclohydrolase|uniref:Bifunctional purine biosynthesis protein PurH n=1 Tax=candidate division WOR-3 bacterium TaxID=2052148 RepID=A0A350HAV2_UNCW3|nr:bifunctional phosphoribosylaminoimidazolecarboxamide formyltransferase/IMP cyclohydrolase PurH [candidate division WOR-3 bacterium]
MKVKTVLISLYDKDKIEILLEPLVKNRAVLYATASTAEHIKKAGYEVHLTEEITGISSLLNGRVKTLNTKLFAGILARREHDDISGIDVLFDMAIVDLYPFESAFSKMMDAFTEESEMIEKIDIGGISLIRAAAKNYENVAVICEKIDYEIVANELSENEGQLSIETKRFLAHRAFNKTVAYDSAVSEYFSMITKHSEMPSQMNIILRKESELRYGENPHQRGGLYSIFPNSLRKPGIHSLDVFHGKEMSFNNYLDLESAINIVGLFNEPTAAIIKHNNPCGVGTANTIAEAYEYAYLSDPKSAYGGIAALNRTCDTDTAEIMKTLFLEVIFAEDFTDEAKQILGKKKNLRLVKGNIKNRREMEFRNISGAMLVQDKDNVKDCESILQIVTEKHPTDKEIKAMMFAWNVARNVKSNGIVIATQNRTFGIGAGQTSRVDAVDIAIKKAGGMTAYTGGSAVASDGFFPFRDSIDAIYKSGIYAIIQPGGSVNDKEVIEACNEYQIAMAFTNKRHFKH